MEPLFPVITDFRLTRARERRQLRRTLLSAFIKERLNHQSPEVGGNQEEKIVEVERAETQTSPGDNPTASGTG